MKRPKVTPRVLLVEGKDEQFVLPELLELAGVPWPDAQPPVYIGDAEGVENLLDGDRITTESKATGVVALGVVVDANGDPAARWQRLRKRIAQRYPAFPAALPTDGVVHEEPDKPRIGVWVMPDNVRAGMLETVLLALRAGDAALHEHARDATTRARALGASFRDPHREKAELHAWLAWQDPPGRRLHDAVRAKVLPPLPPVTGGFVDWFRRLFAL